LHYFGIELRNDGAHVPGLLLERLRANPVAAAKPII
jgi:hypothetical protein